MTQEEKICLWMEAASLNNDGSAVARRVIVVGEFLEKVGQLNDQSLCRCLAGINFQMPVTVVRLPDSVFIQAVLGEMNVWYTDTGLSPGVVGRAHGGRSRKLFIPICSIPALKITTHSPEDSWTTDRLIRSFAAEAGGRAEQINRGAGNQYVVFDRNRLKEI